MELRNLAEKITNRFINNLRAASDEDIDNMRDGLEKFVFFEINKLSNSGCAVVNKGVYSADALLADFEEWFDDQNTITIGLLDDYTDKQKEAFWEGLRCAGLELKHCIRMNEISGSK